MNKTQYQEYSVINRPLSRPKLTFFIRQETIKFFIIPGFFITYDFYCGIFLMAIFYFIIMVLTIRDEYFYEAIKFSRGVKMNHSAFKTKGDYFV